MSSQNKVKTMTVAALLCAIGIMIPMYMPIKLIIEPASFTLASHVAIFIAMFISPIVGAFVVLGTAFGFLLAGFPPVVVLRAFSQVIFITIGALLLKKNNNLLLSYKTMIPFAVIISVIHALGEVGAALLYYSFNTPSNSIMNTMIYLVGIGTFVHSLVDFTIALLIWKPIQHVINIPANAKVKSGKKVNLKY
jgi:hypothetical protein